MGIKIELLDKNNQVKTGVLSYDKIIKPYIAMGQNLAVLGIKNMSWQKGDQIKVTVDKPQQYWVQLDETLMPTLVYMANKDWIYTVDPDEKLADTAFTSKHHYFAVRKATELEINTYRNLALNPHDQLADSGVYPHAVSNVTEETNPRFVAQNAIDGKLANISHGSYPYGSWGIHGRNDATLTIDFGRDVKIDDVKLLFRNDHLEWNHDGYWDQVTLEFADGSTQSFKTTGTKEFQDLKFDPIVTSKVTLKNLDPAQGSAEFKALTQIEVYGSDFKK